MACACNSASYKEHPFHRSVCHQLQTCGLRSSSCHSRLLSSPLDSSMGRCWAVYVSLSSLLHRTLIYALFAICRDKPTPEPLPSAHCPISAALAPPSLLRSINAPRWTPLSVTLCRASTLREVTEGLCALFAGMLCSLFSSLFLSFIFFVLSEYTRNLPALLGQLMSLIFIDRTDMCADINNPNACESFRAPMETLPSSLTENVHSYLCIDF